jgi:TolA-binding protein
MQGIQQQGGPAQHAAQEPMRRRIGNFISQSVQRFRVVLLVILVAAAAFFVGYVVYNEINKKLAADSTVLAEAAQTSFDAWQNESDTTKKTAQEKDLRAQLDTLVKRYPRQYGAQRGLFLRAELNYGVKAWDAARKDYESLAARFPNSYLAPVSLFNAAVSAEEAGDLAGASTLYAKVSGTYKDSTVAPRALFDSGRLAEQRGSWSEAQAAYEQIDSLYSQSMWDKLAKNRIIELKVQGKIK